LLLVAACGDTREVDALATARMPVQATAPACSASKLASIRAPATAEALAVKVNCSFELGKGEVITKRLIFEGSAASGVTVDCHGAMLGGGEGALNDGKTMVEVHSRAYVDSAGVKKWERPENVTIRNCRIAGTVHVWGMATNGQGADLKESSRLSGHVQRARDNAPTGVLLDHVTITGRGHAPLYLAPGVTFTRLIDSTVNGVSNSTAVYMDAESYGNVIQGTYIYTDTGQNRELIALDSSSYNTLIDNHFSSLDHGGIFLYRNCGEGGTIRHSTPSHNTIVNNVFFYNKYDGPNPSVFLGSRNGNRSYCGDDSGYPFGSSASDRDYASYNVVMQNQFYKRAVSEMIRVGNSSYDTSNFIAHNETVASEVSRLAGCFLPDGHSTDFITHGASQSLVRLLGGVPTCVVRNCLDGELVDAGTCAMQAVSFGCQVSGSNSGCSGVATCPKGSRQVLAARAACNLESGTVSNATLASVGPNQVSVVRASDNVEEGLCCVGDTCLYSGTATTRGPAGALSTAFGCREHDENGGDCHILGTLYCQKP
jgi:parallel beta-helix repeat protein